jgi:hypothetical protein
LIKTIYPFQMYENHDLLIHPRKSVIYNKTYEEWSIEWWKWLLRIPADHNPLVDFTGQNAIQYQPNGNVIFLCQTIESKFPFPSRHVSISPAKSVFMPIINWISIEGIDGNDYPELIDVAKKKIDVVKEMKFTINNVTLTKELWNFRVASGPFKAKFPHNNVLGIDAGNKKCASDGYWLFVKNLSLSTNISTSGVCSTGETNIGVEYKLEVK